VIDDASAFLALAGPLLLQDEARNNLILGITGTLVTRPEVYPEFHLWLVEESGTPVAAAIMTPPNNLIISDPASEEALAPLAEVVAGSDVRVPGTLGNEPWVGRFVDTWLDRVGQAAMKTMSHGVFSIDRVQDVPQVPGGPRPADADDLELLIDWLSAFREEADPHSPTDRIPVAVRSRLQRSGSQTGFWIWEVDGVPVSLSGHGGQTPNGIRIGPVYTPERYRRQGYATGLVAAHSAWLLDHGHRFCFLYTDLANPTSNSIYTRIGYRRVAEASRYIFQD
jgi:predicted GNAT family acetyltransferase